MILPRRQVLLGALAAIVSAGCGGGTDRSIPTTTFFSLTSDAGDLIGRGQSGTFTPATAMWQMTSVFEETLWLWITPTTPTYELPWILSLTSPTGQTLKEGAYEGTERFATPEHAELIVTGDGRGCNQATGRFVIYKLVRAADGTIERLHMTFEQHCEGGVPALRGEISIVPGSGVTQSVAGSG
jgi:hypothetical protein